MKTTRETDEFFHWSPETLKIEKSSESVELSDSDHTMTMVSRNS